MQSRYVAIVAVLLTALVFTGGAYASHVGPFADNPPEPTPTIQSLSITDRGCRGSINEFASSTNGPNGKFEYSSVVNTSSPNTELTANSVRTSPENAEIVTYRTDLTTHDPPNDTSTCKGEIAYRIVVDAPSGSHSVRMVLYLDGRMISCGGGSHGPNIGCARLLQYDEQVPSVSTNDSVNTSGPSNRQSSS